MMELGKALNWYQKKIGAYDKQLWEKSVEQRILRGVNAIPKKTAKIKADLIDVDLVRGSYFPKAKPQHSWLAATSSGILRLLLFPVFFRWWKLQTCPLVVTVLLVLYFLQIIAIILYTTGDNEFSEVPLSEVTTPVVMMLVLAVIHSHIVATLNNKSSHNKIPQAKRKRLKRKSRLRSSADYESKSSPETASEDRADHSQNCQAFHSTPFESKEKPGYSNSKSVLTEKDNYKEGLDLNQKTKGCFLAAKIGNRNVLRVASSNRLKNSDEESGLDSIDLAESPVENEIFNFGQHLPQCSNLCCGGQSSGFIEVEQDDKKYSKTSKVVLASVFTDAQSLPTAPTEDVLKSLTERGDEDGTSEADQDVPQSLVQQDNITNLKEECFVKYHLIDKPSSRNVMLDLQDSKELIPDWAEQEFLKSINSNQTWEDDDDEKTLIWRRFSDTVENRRRTTLEAESDNQLDKSCRRYSEDSKVTPRTRNKIGLSLDLNTTNRKSNIIGSIQERRETSSLLHLSPHPITERGHYSSCESEVDTTCPNTPTKPQTSDLEWPIITNTDCNSYSSDSTSEASEGEEDEVGSCDDPFAWEFHEASPHPVTGNYTGCEKVSCTIWERNECKKVDLTVLDISSAIVRKVDFSTQSNEYLIIGLLFSILVSLLPVLFRLQNSVACDALQDVTSDVLELNMPSTDEVARVTEILQKVVLGSSWRMNLVVLIVAIERFTLSVFYFFLLSVAERTFKQRFLYAKHFCHITSARRARRSDLPHFRLNKVRNIKTWLSVRSYLKKHGPQRSVDVIVSTAFIIGICMVSFLCLQLLKESDQFGERLYCWEAFCWCLSIGIFLMRFMILGSKLNKKYRNFSVLITEQINLYLHMEQKPHKKEELMLANNVLKLASDLLKELESPFKISGLCANPYLYNITKVVILSAFSAVLTELLGFKLKLHKIKIK